MPTAGLKAACGTQKSRCIFPIYNFFKKKEAEAVAKADGIVCLTYAAENIIKEWAAYKFEIPLEVIPCSADLQLFDPAAINEKEKAALKKELDVSEDDLILTYLGSIGGWYLIDEMMQFCRMLIDKIPATKLLFISPHRHEEIKIAAERSGIALNKIIIKRANRQQVPLLLSLSKYAIFFIWPCYSKLSSSPTKHGEIMAMGIPLITNSGVGDVETIVAKYNSGIVMEDFTEANFTEAIMKIAAEPGFDNEGIRQGAKEFYSLNTAIEKYISIYNSILKQ